MGKFLTAKEVTIGPIRGAQQAYWDREQPHGYPIPYNVTNVNYPILWQQIAVGFQLRLTVSAISFDCKLLIKRCFMNTWMVRGLIGFFVYALGASVAYAASMSSIWTTNKIVVDGVNKKEWDHHSTALRLQRGVLQAQNDGRRLYLFIDLGGDTHQDQPLKKAPWGDFIEISVDVNRDRKVTPKVDVSYGQFPGTYSIGRQYYIRPGAMTGLQKSKARVAAGFGRSLGIPVSHRTWEIAIPLNEIKAKPGDNIRIGIHTHSQRPRFSDQSPANIHKDFSRFHEIRISSGKVGVKHKKMKFIQPAPAKFTQGTVTQGRSGSTAKPVQKTIASNGHVVFKYPDGKIIEKFPGGQTITMPNAKPLTYMYSTQAPAAIPPSLPDNAESKWLQGLSSGLMGIIETMVKNDAEAIQHYRQYEGSGASLYEQINKRTTTINYLITP